MRLAERFLTVTDAPGRPARIPLAAVAAAGGRCAVRLFERPLARAALPVAVASDQPSRIPLAAVAGKAVRCAAL